MDFLLDPNVAYLILLAGVLLGFLAIITPGTGMLEVGALFCLALAGYEIYYMPFNWWALGILALSIIPFVFSMQKPRRELFLALSIILLVIGSIFMFPRADGQAGVNPLIAITVSVLMAGFFWIAIGKAIQAASSKPLLDLNRLVGQIGQAKTTVDGEGSVQVGGELWSARSEQKIPEGSRVRVVSREGFVVIVERVNHSSL